MGPARHATELGDRWIAELDRHGVARAALIASIPGDAVSVAEAVAHHPHRFVGFFMHNPIGRRRRCRAGAVAERLPDARHLPLPRDARLPAGRRVRRTRVPRGGRHGAAVFVHCGVLTVGVRKKLGPARAASICASAIRSRWPRMALGFPQVPVIVPHFGAGFFREALMAADQCPTIHFDTSSSNSWIRFDGGQTLEGVFSSALAVAGPSRLLFGTDSSFFPRGWQAGIYEEQQRIMGSLGVSVADGTRSSAATSIGCSPLRVRLRDGSRTSSKHEATAKITDDTKSTSALSSMSSWSSCLRAVAVELVSVAAIISGMRKSVLCLPAFAVVVAALVDRRRARSAAARRRRRPPISSSPTAAS